LATSPITSPDGVLDTDAGSVPLASPYPIWAR